MLVSLFAATFGHPKAVASPSRKNIEFSRLRAAFLARCQLGASFPGLSGLKKFTGGMMQAGRRQTARVGGAGVPEGRTPR